MGRAKTARQGDFLALMEPGPTLAPMARATLIPLIVTLLLEVVAGERRDDASKRVAGDEQDRS